MTEDRTKLLQQMPIFGGVTSEALAFLLERVSVVTVPAGGYFFRQGSQGTSAFVMVEGRVTVSKSHEGDEIALRQLVAGDCFGEVALLDFGERSASVRADEECRAIELTARNLHDLSKAHLDQFALIYMNLGRELGRLLREADARLFQARRENNAIAESYAFGQS